MTHEEKELRLKDLCARLPYGVKVAFFNEDLTHHSEPKTLIGIECINNLNYSKLEDEDGNTTIVEFVKPYLFPLSSMTEGQLYEVSQIIGKDVAIFSDYLLTIDHRRKTFSYQELDALFNWFDKNHFDYRNLIEKGLAIDATGLNIY